MDDDTLQKLIDGQLASQDNEDSKPQNQEKTKTNYTFMTPAEAGFKTADPNKNNDAPLPQPGMTFTPTGGSVSEINHQLNRQNNKENNK